jgi:hypothetical protein
MGAMKKIVLMKAMAGPMDEEDMPQEAYETSEKNETYGGPGDGAKKTMRQANRRMRKMQRVGGCYSGDKCFKRN